MKIIVIDDEKNICLAIAAILEDEGHTVKYALNYTDGLKLIKQEKFEILFLDIWLPDIDGVDGLQEIKRLVPELEVIMISGHGTIETAVDTIRYGAYDFLEKPLSLERIVMIVKHLSERLSILSNLRQTRFNMIKRYELIGVSDEITKLKERIEKVATMNSWVLITGENGTGKEHVSRLIHMLGKRADKPFVELNCSAIPKELIESELFGHEKGAFTGATHKKIGKFELADGGTIFLDEIGDMELAMQSKLLRVLESGEFSRVGGNDIVCSDFRLISATNKNLEVEISTNRFREDLYYRINVIPIEVPPLKRRKIDIPHLVTHFLKEAVAVNGLGEKKISDRLMKLFMSYDWPGNVRQLKNIVERMVVLSDNSTIDITEPTAQFLLKDIEEKDFDDIDKVVSNYDYQASLRDAKDEFEKRYILSILKSCNWNIVQAAKMLDMERTYLYKKIKAYDLDKYREEKLNDE